MKNNRMAFLVPLIVTLFALQGCPGNDPSIDFIEVKNANGKTVYVPKCKQTVQYIGDSMTIKGVKIKIPQAANAEGEIGELTADQKKLIEAAVITQILDQHQFGTCQLIWMYVVNGTSEGISDFLGQVEKDDALLTQLASIISSGHREAISSWIDSYSARAAVITKKAIDSNPTAAAALTPIAANTPALNNAPGLNPENKPAPVAPVPPPPDVQNPAKVPDGVLVDAIKTTADGPEIAVPNQNLSPSEEEQVNTVNNNLPGSAGDAAP